MWMIVITVSSGLVVVSIMAVLVACRPRHKEDLEGGDMGDMEMELEVQQEPMLRKKTNEVLYLIYR